jgi:cytidylate kinase
MKKVREVVTNYLRNVAENQKVVAEGVIFSFDLLYML